MSFYSFIHHSHLYAFLDTIPDRTGLGSLVLEPGKPTTKRVGEGKHPTAMRLGYPHMATNKQLNGDRKLLEDQTM